MLKTDVFKHINHLFIEFHNVKVNIPKNIDNELMLKIKQKQV